MNDEDRYYFFLTQAVSSPLKGYKYKFYYDKEFHRLVKVYAEEKVKDSYTELQKLETKEKYDIMFDFCNKYGGEIKPLMLQDLSKFDDFSEMNFGEYIKRDFDLAIRWDFRRGSLLIKKASEMYSEFNLNKDMDIITPHLLGLE